MSVTSGLFYIRCSFLLTISIIATLQAQFKVIGVSIEAWDDNCELSSVNSWVMTPQYYSKNITFTNKLIVQ